MCQTMCEELLIHESKVLLERSDNQTTIIHEWVFMTRYYGNIQQTSQEERFLSQDHKAK